MNRLKCPLKIEISITFCVLNAIARKAVFGLQQLAFWTRYIAKSLFCYLCDILIGRLEEFRLLAIVPPFTVLHLIITEHCNTKTYFEIDRAIKNERLNKTFYSIYLSFCWMLMKCWCRWQEQGVQSNQMILS